MYVFTTITGYLFLKYDLKLFVGSLLIMSKLMVVKNFFILSCMFVHLLQL